MKSYILLVTLLIIIFCHWSSASNTEIEQRKSSSVLELMKGRLQRLWTWVWTKGEGEDTLTARCFGVARRLKFAMPMILFKLGVIVTILVFLTIFSLKGLGLLVMLVMFNSGGLAAKWALGQHSTKHLQPQDVHFHLHSKDFVKDGHYGHDHGWYDRSDDGETDFESLDERLKRLNIYTNNYQKY